MQCHYLHRDNGLFVESDIHNPAAYLTPNSLPGLVMYGTAISNVLAIVRRGIVARKSRERKIAGLARLYKDVAQTSFERVVNLANEGLSQSEIANELQLNKSNVSRHLKKAVEQGLILRGKKCAVAFSIGAQQR